MIQYRVRTAPRWGFATDVSADTACAPRVRGRSRAWRTAVAGAIAVACVVAGTCAVGVRPACAAAVLKPPGSGGLSIWKIDDRDPVSTIPTEAERSRNPLQFGYWLQDLSDKALKAERANDPREAIKLYTAMAKAVPDSSFGFTKLCTQYERSGQNDNAIVACGLALFRDGATGNDYVHYAHLVLTKPGSLQAADVKAMMLVIDHLRQDPAQGGLADELECELGVETNDVPKLDECTKGLAASAPDDPKTILYQWNLAMHRGHREEAARLVQRAKAVGMRPEGVRRLEAATHATSPQRHWAFGAGALLAAASLAALVVWVLRRRRGGPGEGAMAPVAPIVAPVLPSPPPPAG